MSSEFLLAYALHSYSLKAVLKPLMAIRYAAVHASLDPPQPMAFDPMVDLQLRPFTGLTVSCDNVFPFVDALVTLKVCLFDTCEQSTTVFLCSIVCFFAMGTSFYDEAFKKYDVRESFSLLC